jgi:hypothetical protein
MLTESEFEELANVNLRLIVREKSLIKFILQNRGYDEKFQERIESLLNSLTPYSAIDWEDPLIVGSQRRPQIVGKPSEEAGDAQV